MKELVEKIATLVAEFKASLEIEKAMKEFRKVSLEESKK